MTAMKPSKRPQAPSFGARRVAGVSMIEVLIAVVVLAYGLLGVAAMQMVALRNSQSAHERSQATVQTYAILDAMRANRNTAQIGGYNMALTCNVPATNTANLAAGNLHDWMTSLKDTMGATACGGITCGSTDCVITVQWNDSRANAGNRLGGGSATEQVVTRTRL
jgi:type IV pilus assembly protein PilV